MVRVLSIPNHQSPGMLRLSTTGLRRSHVPINHPCELALLLDPTESTFLRAVIGGPLLLTAMQHPSLRHKRKHRRFPLQPVSPLSVQSVSIPPPDVNHLVLAGSNAPSWDVSTLSSRRISRSTSPAPPPHVISIPGPNSSTLRLNDDEFIESELSRSSIGPSFVKSIFLVQSQIPNSRSGPAPRHQRDHADTCPQPLLQDPVSVLSLPNPRPHPHPAILRQSQW